LIGSAVAFKRPCYILWYRSFFVVISLHGDGIIAHINAGSIGNCSNQGLRGYFSRCKAEDADESARTTTWQLGKLVVDENKIHISIIFTHFILFFTLRAYLMKSIIISMGIIPEKNS